ncbi:DUF1707 SHOCT-like domain-containing protein [Saccharomonospora piscinae]|uniref:DUF1707 SHOCT-like domain-containing protein n=1 Tax=Saccharomonospora piscinae TaxID=687388 RepID=UPI0004660A70|nr:DUF1707 domain-containing protein [Saccharomonospora piscinae]
MADGAEYRLSDAERQEALDALSEHVRTGRLDLVEYDERAAKVSAARTRRDLAPLFADLPEPRPAILAPPPATRESGAEVSQPWQQRLAASAVPLAALVAIVLFFTVARGMVFVFVLPLIVALLAGSFASRRRG